MTGSLFDSIEKTRADAAPFPARVAEDLTALTIEAARTAPHLCRGCAAYHGTWPALRLAGAMTGLDADQPVLIGAVQRLLAGGGQRRILVAGSADTGLLETLAVAAAASPADVRFTVIDLCETPLKLVRTYAERVGLEVDTRAADIRDYVPAQSQDIVLAHSVLRFVHPDEHRGYLTHMRRWLKPDGCMLYGTRLRDVDYADASRDRKRMAIKTLRSNRDIPPEIRFRITDWLKTHLARDTSTKLRQVWTHAEILELFGEAGFTGITHRTFSGGDPRSPAAADPPDRIVVAAHRGTAPHKGGN